MEIFKSTMGRILGNLVMIVLCASFKWIPGNYLAFYGVGVLILTISTTIMEGQIRSPASFCSSSPQGSCSSLRLY